MDDIVHIYDADTLLHIISSKYFDRRYAIGDLLSITLAIETDTVILYCKIVGIDDIPSDGQMIYIKPLRLVKNDVELSLP